MSRRLERTGGGGEAVPNATPASAPYPQPLQHQQHRQRQQGLTEWRALLCTLIADREVKSLRHDAKRLLRRLCVTQVWLFGLCHNSKQL